MDLDDMRLYYRGPKESEMVIGHAIFCRERIAGRAIDPGGMAVRGAPAYA
jgi:hypothetical protein